MGRWGEEHSPINRKIGGGATLPPKLGSPRSTYYMFYSPFKSGVKPSIGIDLSWAPLLRLCRILGHSQRVLENFKDSFLRCAHTLYPLHDRVGVPMTKQDSKEEEEREQYSLAQKALLASSQRMRRGGKRGGLITPPPRFSGARSP